MKYKNLIILPLLLIAVACGQLKKADDKIVVVQGGTAESGSADSASLSADLRKLKDFLDLYTENGSVTRTGLTNLLNKYKDRIGGFLAGTGMTTDQIVDFLFQFDLNKDGTVSAHEVSDLLYQRIPIMRWIPSNVSSIDANTLSDNLALEYPAASQVARDGLRDILMRYDEKWAGGNGDGFLNRQELSVAGLLLGVLGQVDFSKGIQLPAQAGDSPEAQKDAADKRIAVGLMNQKLTEQLFGRYTVIKNTELSSADAQLEWIQLALRFYLCDKMVGSFGPDSVIATQDQVTAISLYGYSSTNSDQWTALRKIYSNPMMGGTTSGNWTTIVTFNVMTELDYAAKIWTLAGGDFSNHNLTGLKSHDYLMNDLNAMYPVAGPTLFTPVYWNHISDYDSSDLGGNGDGNIDLSEFALAMAYAKVIDGIFSTYDTDHNGLLSKVEAAALFKTLNLDDPRLIEGFYANKGGMDGRHKLWTELKIFFTGASKIDNLDPYEIHKRLIQVLPHLLNGETVK